MLSLPTIAATALYDAAAATARDHTAQFSLDCTPIRHPRGRALPFEAVALGAGVRQFP